MADDRTTTEARARLRTVPDAQHLPVLDPRFVRVEPARMIIKSLAGLLLLLSASTAAHAAAIQCQLPLDVAGTPQRMAAKDFSTIIRLQNAPLGPLSIAYGPGRAPTSEITAVDGKYHVSRAEGGTMATLVNPADQGAAMLVRATPAAWMDGGQLTGIANLADLNAALAARIRALGCAGDVTTAFRITARATSLTWSVDAVPDTARGTVIDRDVVIVGVFSNHDRARSFMAGGLDLHAHMLVPATGMSGHVGALALADGAMVQLAAVADPAEAGLKRDFDAYLQAFDHDERTAMKIGLDELLAGYAKGEIQLIDVRFPEERAAWSVGIGQHIPLDELPVRLGELDRTKTIVTMCPHADRAGIARLYLTLNGFRSRYLSDGMLKLVEYLRGDRAREYMTRLQKEKE